jgi:hypothetical protein
MEADHVAAGQQFVQRNIAAADGREFRGFERIAGQHLAAEALEDAGQVDADLAGADHAGHFAPEIETEQAFEGEVALAHAGIGLVDLAVERKDQRRGVLGDGVGRIGGNAAYAQAQFAGGVEIDIVEPGTAQRDHARSAGDQDFQFLAPKLVVHESADTVMTPRQMGGVRIQARLQIEQRVTGTGLVIGLVKEFAIVGTRAEDRNFQGSPPVIRTIFRLPLQSVRTTGRAGFGRPRRSGQPGACTPHPEA